MNREDDPQLWDLLAHSDAPKLTPFFARNVVREVRAVAPARSLPALFAWRRLLPAAAAALLAATAVTTVQYRHHREVDRQDAKLIADLDDSFPSDDDADDWDETATL